MSAIPNQWKDVDFVTRWDRDRKESRRQTKDELKKKLDQKWFAAPLLAGVTLVSKPVQSVGLSEIEVIQWENESLGHRARRLEGQKAKPQNSNARCHYQVPPMLEKHGSQWILAPIAHRAKEQKLTKAKAMFDAGLTKKAERELACGILGGPVICQNGHQFRVSYECGNRYCVTCGPREASALFARQHQRLLFASTRMLLCGDENCSECNEAILAKRVPHWPPAHGVKPRIVVANLDFTLRNTGKTPGPAMMRELNSFIKKFCRALERRFGISRKEYGLAYCDELGANNTNAHAHGIYVGPWLPQKRRELSKLWAEITGGSFIIWIKYARNFSAALHHAVKYPAKFAEKSTPARLAQLEVIFHRVRRFHTLAAFYAPESPEEEKPEAQRCPICESPLSMRGSWQSIFELERRGFRDLAEVAAEIARARGLDGGLDPPG